MGRQLVRTLAAVALLAARALAGANLTAAKGLEHGLVVDGLKRPRGVVEDSRGNLLVVERGKGIVRLVLDDGEGAKVRVASRTMAVNESKWSVENSLDNMHRHNRDIHQTNPGDELNFHGQPSNPHSRVYGRNFGYPACVAIFDASVIQGYPGGARTGMQMTGDHMRGMNFTDQYCQSHTVAPVITLDAHLAPLDIDFLDDGSAAFISMHGSWNRKPGVGYRGLLELGGVGEGIVRGY
ncbi:hypothetical protein CDD80_6788 [Ophiocordyceps camponoti-rufipedis]|uniref:Pyrroloquinoline quinone-dependent pyranose dehydrogenase beta-propeller domain-containing protein n=1 Tax=Ophiocordyceps camponoti-rufipedis TaxID=2004952 RepID=A0A2C5YPC8_9HYPO|nr:hypothetical protein CDD80_6788 [Ophiocordyceps camponoti-rufipedis]